MGKGGCVEQKVAATPATKPEVTSTDNNKSTYQYVDPIERAKKLGEWVSPFGPTKVDPRLRAAAETSSSDGNTDQIIQTINSEFPTKSELRSVIPKHCFERSLPRSLAYVVRDVLQGVLIWYITYHIVGLRHTPPDGWSLLENPLGWLVWRLAWNVYAVVMGFAIGGLWVLGHECGHGAFSAYPIINNIVGWTLHSAMLVPYFAWAFSHAKHHRRTNDLMDGETHTPPLHTEMGLDSNHNRISNADVKRVIYGGGIHQACSNNLLGHARAHDAMGDEGFALFMMWSRLFWGWQIYLCGIKSTGHLAADGSPIPKGTFPDHFRPSSKLFPPKMYTKVLISDIGIAAVITALTYFTYQHGFNAVWMWYFGPYMLVNCFLVTVTWLHHTDPTVPQFDPDNWTWMKGALAGTIDRPLYGWMNFCSHNISTTHVVHHLFHEIPHYHALEATKHIREYLEPKGLYNYDPTDAVAALWKICKRCHFVDSWTNGIQYYQSLEDIPRSSTSTSTRTTNKNNNKAVEKAEEDNKKDK